YFTAAGNDNARVNGHDVDSYEATVYRGTSCMSGYLDCHNFDPTGGAPDSSFGMTIAGNATFNYVLQWAQPWFGVTTDYDLFMFDDAGNLLLFSRLPNTGATGIQEPFEYITGTNPSSSSTHVNIVVARKSGPAVRFKMFAIEGSQSIVAVDRPNS